MFTLIKLWFQLPKHVLQIKSLLEVLISSDPRVPLHLKPHLQNQQSTKKPEPTEFLLPVDDELQSLFEEEMEMLRETNPTADQESLSQQAWLNASNRFH
jgi:hypothetical protein